MDSNAFKGLYTTLIVIGVVIGLIIGGLVWITFLPNKKYYYRVVDINKDTCNAIVYNKVYKTGDIVEINHEVVTVVSKPVIIK